MLQSAATPTRRSRPGTTKAKIIEYRGDTWYWTKDREFEKFLRSADQTPASDLNWRLGADQTSRRCCNRHGWAVRDSIDLSRSAKQYREYIEQSRGEFTVARDQYVRPRTGWFSDRTACYLAAGRPVITQETGFSRHLSSGKGLFGFTTMEDIVQAMDAIESDYAGHCRAAREVAAGILRGGESRRQPYGTRRAMKIVVAGTIGRSGLGGQAWATMQYLLGFRALGHDVFYLEDCGKSSWVYDWEKAEWTTELDYPAEYVGSCLSPHGLPLDLPHGRRFARRGVWTTFSNFA